MRSIVGLCVKGCVNDSLDLIFFGPLGTNLPRRFVFQTGHFTDAAAVRAASVYSGGNTTITVPASGGAVVVLVGVNIATILNEDLIVNGIF